MDKTLKPNTTEYKRAFNRENYDQILFSVPKGKKAEFQSFIAGEKRWKSLNAFIYEAVLEKIDRESGNRQSSLEHSGSGSD